MITSMGWKRTFTELVPRYPGLIMMPAFTSFTFGPIDTQANGFPFCCGGDSFGNCRSGQLGLSFDFSWINIAISSVIMFISSPLELAIGMHNSFFLCTHSFYLQN